jgi:hypothetical protein
MGLWLISPALPRDVYLIDVGHKSAGAKLVEAAVDGVGGILVYDLGVGFAG